jgi:hypothetical protein
MHDGHNVCVMVVQRFSRLTCGSVIMMEEMSVICTMEFWCVEYRMLSIVRYNMLEIIPVILRLCEIIRNSFEELECGLFGHENLLCQLLHMLE